MSIEVHGHCDERFAPLREAFIANFDAGLDLGASLGVTHQGKAVVNLWAGYANPKRTRVWAENTIVQIASTTKTLLGLAMLMQIDRGLLALDAPVARYWPEFAQGGKAHVTVLHVLTMSAGIPGLEPTAPFAVVCDWDAITARVAAEPHWFGGERRICYHATTYGYIAGELIRRVDGRLPWIFCREEIIQRSGADIVLGVEDADLPRIAAPLFPTGMPPFESDPIAVRARAATESAPDVASQRKVINPGGSGLSNGAGVARLGAILANGGELDGVRYISASLAARVGEEQFRGACPFFGPMRYGLGFALDTAEYPMPLPSFYHWGGAGGSFALIDPVSRISVGFAPNDMHMTGGGVSLLETRKLRFTDALKVVLPRL